MFWRLLSESRKLLFLEKTEKGKSVHVPRLKVVCRAAPLSLPSRGEVTFVAPLHVSPQSATVDAIIHYSADHRRGGMIDGWMHGARKEGSGKRAT